jgi:putative oxidoreductase
MTHDAGKLVLRLSLGIMILLHGLAKVSGGVGGISGMLQGVGLPATLAYGAYIGEVLAPLLVILGLYARVGAALIVVNMLFAIYLAHRDDVFMLTKQGGWALELQGMFLFTALALALIGPGRYGVNRF